MKYEIMDVKMYSHNRSPEEIIEICPEELKNLLNVLRSMESPRWGLKKQTGTGSKDIAQALKEAGWQPEQDLSCGSKKKENLDFVRGKVLVEIEIGRKVDIISRDMVRFEAGIKNNKYAVGVLITLLDQACHTFKINCQNRGDKDHMSCRLNYKKSDNYLQSEFGKGFASPVLCIGVN
jgi:hypothetical protein